LLDKIESGEFSREKMLSQFYELLKKNLQKAKKFAPQSKKEIQTQCPVCKEGTVNTKLSKNKKDIIFMCSRYPYCDFVSAEDPAK
jgi:ssDNA-binding Zn-finger/Zn-ribbon topoisomerase 1